MKRWSLAVGTALVLCACGRGGAASSGTHVNDVAAPDASRDCDHVTIRLLGTAARDVSALRLSVDRVEATCAGAPVDVTHSACGRTLDVSDDATVHDVGEIPLHRDGGDVAVTVHFAGGHACKGAEEGDLEGCLAPITFDLDPARVDRTRCHALVLLDVGRSVAEDGAGLTLLPNLRVVY